MSNRINVSAVTPCYNEGEGLIHVIHELQKAKMIDEILLIDDGSKQTTKELISQITNIRVFTHKHNLGKTLAMRTGVENSRGKYIFFLDADLKGLKSNVVDEMIRVFLSQKPLLLLGERATNPIFDKIGLELAFTGERLIHKEFLLKNPSLLNSTGYLFEPLCNLMTFNHYLVASYKMDGVRQKNKIFKSGLVGLYQDLKMHSKYISILGIKNYLWQCWYVKTQIIHY